MARPPAPPAKPACDPSTADLFDHEFTFGMALAICQTCPVVEWCLEVVDPARSYFDGIAGNVAWNNGKPLGKWTRIRRDPNLIDYLARRGLLKHLN